MKTILHRLVSFSLLLTCLLCAASQVHRLNSKTRAASLKPADAATQAKVNEAYGKLPFSFEINRGQADAPISFLSKGGNYSILFRPGEVRLNLNVAELNKKGESGRCGAQTARPSPFSLRFINANPSPRMEGVDELPGKTNYIIGSDPKKWRTDIPTYAKVRYREVWPGVGVVFYGAQQRLEYDFVVAPGADPRSIKLSFGGAKKIDVDANGDLILRLAEGELRQLKPVIYQDVKGARRIVDGRYVVKGDLVGFEIGRYDRSRELVIDPVLVYAARTLAGAAIGVDGEGAAYIAGTVTQSFSDFVRVADISITKLSPDGSQQVYNTIIGGSDRDGASSIAVDATGNVYVTGATFSTDFPLNFPVPTDNVGAGVCFKSVDGGAAWANSGRGLAPPVGGDLKALVIDPANPSVIYAEAGILGGAGLYRSDDRGKQWTHIRFNGVSLVKPLLVAPGNPSTLFVSTFQGLRKSFDGGMTLSETGLNRGEIRALIIDRNNPANLYATNGDAVFKSTDGGNNWSEAVSGLPGTRVINSLALDPSKPSTLYAALVVDGNGINSVYKSVDRAATWMAVSAPPVELIPRSLIVHSTNSTVFVGTGRGVYKSSDGGNRWESAGIPGFVVHSLVLDPTNPSTIYALPSISGTTITGRGIFKSSDNGMTWNSLGPDLSQSYISSLAIDPLNPAIFYAGTLANSEAFVLKLDPTGRNVVYARYYGGPGDDEGKGIAIDPAGNAYITGVSAGQPPPLVNNLPVTMGAGFMAKLNAQGSNFVYSTLLAGAGKAIAVDRAGKAYVTGEISSSIPMTVKNGFRTSQGEFSPTDAFAVMLDPEKAGEESLLYSTYIGDTIRNDGRGIAVDADGKIYVVSFEFGSVFDAAGEPSGAVFLTKIDPSKSGAASLIWERNLGAGGVPNGVAVDSAGEAYVVGTTNAQFWPVTPGAFQTRLSAGNCRQVPVCSPQPQFPCVCSLPPRPGCPPVTNIIDIPCKDAFLMKVNAAGTALSYSTYLGADNNDDQGLSIALDAAKNVYVMGVGRAPFTPGAFQNGGGNGFIAKLELGTRSTSITTVSAANYRGPQLAQESLAVGFLDAFGASSENLRARVIDNTGRERTAPVFFSGSGQINFQIPPETPIGDVVAKITSNSVAVASGAFQVVKVAPGVFSADSSGSGLVAAVALRQKPDNTQIYEPIIRFDPTLNKIVAIPIDLGPAGDRVFLAIFGTGWRFRSSETAAKVTVGGVDVPVLYVGPQGIFAGQDQINAELTRTLEGKGEVDLVIMVDDKLANTTRVNIK